MSDNEHFIRSRSFSGWTHTLLVSRATASPRKRPLSGTADLDVDDLWRPLALPARLSLRRKEMRLRSRKHARNEGSRRFRSAPLRQRVPISGASQYAEIARVWGFIRL